MSTLAELNNINRERRLRELTKTFKGIERPLKNAPTMESLKDLIAELHRVFEKDHVNIEYVNHLMLSYKSNPLDWIKFTSFDKFRYTRNLVDSGNGKFNLMILCWGEGHGSAIHDHADSHCFMKMLMGELQEVRYAWPSKKLQDLDEEVTADIGILNENECGYSKGEELKEISRKALECNGVCYINDTLGLHRVENPDRSNVAISLHLYCPPFDSCSVFNKTTGKRTNCKVTFWSKYDENVGNGDSCCKK